MAVPKWRLSMVSTVQEEARVDVAAGFKVDLLSSRRICASSDGKMLLPMFLGSRKKRQVVVKCLQPSHRRLGFFVGFTCLWIVTIVEMVQHVCLYVSDVSGLRIQATGRKLLDCSQLAHVIVWGSRSDFA